MMGRSRYYDDCPRGCDMPQLGRVQWTAVAIAAAGVLWLTWSAGHPPWIAVALALTFGLYGLVRKTVPVDALPGFAAETLLLQPYDTPQTPFCSLRRSLRCMSERTLGLGIWL
jgi:chloramphenicol-sensitive protein RarD